MRQGANEEQLHRAVSQPALLGGLDGAVQCRDDVFRRLLQQVARGCAQSLVGSQSRGATASWQLVEFKSGGDYPCLFVTPQARKNSTLFGRQRISHAREFPSPALLLTLS